MAEAWFPRTVRIGNPRPPVRFVLCSEWSTQPLHLYTGLILRQLACNNLETYGMEIPEA